MVKAFRRPQELGLKELVLIHPKGYLVIPDSKSIPRFIDEAYEIRSMIFPYIERAKNTDPHKRATTFSKALRYRNYWIAISRFR